MNCTGLLPGIKPGEHANRNAAGHRPAVQMPQVVMGEQRAEARDMAIFADRGVGRQIFAEELAGHGVPTFYLGRRELIDLI